MLRLGLFVCLVLAAAEPVAADEPAVAGYADFAAFRGQLEAIASSPHAGLESLALTRGKRNVYLLTVGMGRIDEKPAVLIVGGVHPPHLLGSELAVRMARRLVDEAEHDAATRKLLSRVAFYFIPRPSPDAMEAFFRRPHVERIRNERPVDDDRDGEVDEDGPDDLDGDGWITAMRVLDPAGEYVPHPEDPRVMVKAEAKRGEQGRWSLYVEGRDDDGDEHFNEDPPGGVAFNRNFTFEYPYFGDAAGPHQVSEPESRAVADFAFSHPNIAAVLSFTPEDNLMRPWEAEESAASKRIKTSLLPADAPYYKHLVERYQEIHGGENPPKSPPGEGSFSEWAYFHYGRWSLAARGWWIPKVEEKPAAKDEADGATDEDKGHDEAAEASEAPARDKDNKTPEKDDRGAEERNALRWFARQRIDGFVPWKRIEHPDFPGKRVEVGGIKPFVMLNPPAEALESLAERHAEFLVEVVDKLPRLRFEEIKAEPLGRGVWRIDVTLANRGFLPTVSEMGRTSEQLNPVQIELRLPKGTGLVTGYARIQIPPLAGGGGTVKRSWLVRVDDEGPVTLKLRAWSPSVGEVEKPIRLLPTAQNNH